MDADNLSEEEFLKTYDPTHYARPSVATDAVVFSYFDARLQVLLIRRKNHPFRGHWAFPGGFVEVYEDPDEAIVRELKEETGIELAEGMVQFGVFGRPDRDPRYHVISIAYLGVVRAEDHEPRAADDAAEARWHPVRNAPPLAFDHARVLNIALERLRRETAALSFAMGFFGRRVTAAELLALYEEIFAEKIDRSRFLRRLTRFCKERPALSRPLRINYAKLHRLEATPGAWWL